MAGNARPSRAEKTDAAVKAASNFVAHEPLKKTALTSTATVSGSTGSLSRSRMWPCVFSETH
jgi:hypothetical protein